jgi:transcriptional regulator with XRE-family HTH domain
MQNTQELQETQIIIANNVQKLREANKWSQTDLALKMDMSISYIAGLESGKRSLSLLKLVQLAKVFEVRMEEMIE